VRQGVCASPIAHRYSITDAPTAVPAAACRLRAGAGQRGKRMRRRSRSGTTPPTAGMMWWSGAR